MKIIDKINALVAKGQTFYSYEYFPPRTEEGVENLFERMERMVAYKPVFCDITWGAGGSTADVTLDIAKRMQNVVCVETMMHLTCTNMPVEKLQSALDEVRQAGIQNILALRGDPPKGQEKFETIEGGLSCALDLVQYIRKTHGDYFGICVAGYPEAHPDTIVENADEMEKNYWANIDYLKRKVEAGGELIITQLFYDVDIFFKFVKDCRSVGITAPIVPGIMPIMTYGGFKRMTGFCKTRVPQDILDTLEGIKDNEEAVKNYGVELGASMCRRLLDGGVPGLHMYSLNLERSVLAILERMGVLDLSKVPRSLPWSLAPVGTPRIVESVRPIFWQHRPRSYMHRTQAWGAAAPAARWSEARALSFAPAAPAHLQRHTSNDSRKAKARQAWGEDLPNGVADVQRVFEQYYQGQVGLLPWHEAEVKQGAGAPALGPQLAALAQQGLLPINAQPAVNGAASEGQWGDKGGYVYQKAYAEFFVSPDNFQSVLTKLQATPRLTYLATTSSSTANGVSADHGAPAVVTNLEEGTADAVTWGVFPGKEVVQPTIVDASSFATWAAEAFQLWTSEWANCYEEGSAARAVISDVAKSWYLVAVVDNDYVSGDLFQTLS